MTERGYWSNQIESVLACLGYAVGLGNIWRFPYLCGKSGGAAFMIPYFITFAFAGLPLFFVELALGQYTQLTPALLYERMAPALAGIGGCMVIATVYSSMSYIVVIAWSLHYLGNSFRSRLKWSHCENEFNTCDCFDYELSKDCPVNSAVYYRGRCRQLSTLPELADDIEQCWARNVNRSMEKGKLIDISLYDSFLVSNETDYAAMIRAIQSNGSKFSPAFEYFYNGTIKEAPDLSPENFGLPNWELVLSLLGAWLLVFGTLLGGAKTSGKVVYFTALFPYVILIALLVRSYTLEAGVQDGLDFFLKPNLSKLYDGETWGAAAQQVFFSLSLSSGGLTTLASYNRFDANIFRYTLIVAFGDLLTSLLVGFVVFPVIGFAANITGRTVEETAAGGIGLAFEIYPLAINRMAAPQFWCFLFFFMLVLLGIDSQMANVETLVTAIVDIAPSLRYRRRKVAVLAVICVIFFALGCMFLTPGGPHLLAIVQDYGAGYPLLFAGLFEIILVAYIYGANNFVHDVMLMLGGNRVTTKLRTWLHPCSPVNFYWYICWVCFTPVLLAAVLGFKMYSEATSSKETSAVTHGLGWFMTMTCVVCIPGFAIYKAGEYSSQPFLTLFRHTDDWQPAVCTEQTESPVQINYELSSMISNDGTTNIDFPLGLDGRNGDVPQVYFLNAAYENQ